MFFQGIHLGQKIVDKFMKLSKISFSMECYTADFCNFPEQMLKICHFPEQMLKICLLGGAWILAFKFNILGFFLKCLNFLRC